jgi:hypothetical protein
VLRGGTGGSRRLEDGAAQGRKCNTKVLKLFFIRKSRPAFL